jgi:hypothetical protein
MVAAMFISMKLSALIVSSISAVAGVPGWLNPVYVRTPLMVSYIAIGMCTWMRHRGHHRPAIAEMSLTMYLPMVVLLMPYLVGVMPGWPVIDPMHVLMLVAMAGLVVRRRDEYSHHAARPLVRHRNFLQGGGV